jgi:predicted glycoside hydrolase/deacetylase ChbG (UPF0249 family)
MNAINPILGHLGFQPDDRVVVVHADDIGMCHATLPAIDELMSYGLVTSASAMAPCPWFPEAVAWHRRCPQFDLGIHLTLTSEWDRYRWGPISTRAESTGLLDDEGYFHRTVQAARRHGRPEWVDAEMRCQVEFAEQSGLTPTHIDNHMFVALCNEFIGLYVQLARERRIPAFLMRARRFSERAGLGPPMGGARPAGIRSLEGRHADGRRRGPRRVRAGRVRWFARGTLLRSPASGDRHPRDPAQHRRLAGARG